MNDKAPDDFVEKLIADHGLTYWADGSNTQYLRLDDDVLVAVPYEGSRDDGPSARKNVELQNEYFGEIGKKGAVIVFFDRMTSQDKGARRQYSNMHNALVCTALVGGSLLTRAMGSFFLGLARTTSPVKLFGTYEQALAWCRQMNATCDRTFSPREEKDS